MFANSFQISFGPNEVQVGFGIQTTAGADNKTTEQQVSVVLTPAGAKLLTALLTELIFNLEEATGHEIPLEPKKIEALKKAIALAKANRQKSTEGKPPT